MPHHRTTGIVCAMVLALATLGSGQARGAAPQEPDRTYGTSRLESHNYSDKGSVKHWRDPETGDEVTSVVPPRQPRERHDEMLLIAPQVYPDWFMDEGDNRGRGQWSGSMPRPSPFGPQAAPGRRPAGR